MPQKTAPAIVDSNVGQAHTPPPRIPRSLIRYIQRRPVQPATVEKAVAQMPVRMYPLRIRSSLMSSFPALPAPTVTAARTAPGDRVPTPPRRIRISSKLFTPLHPVQNVIEQQVVSIIRMPISLIR